MTILNYITGNIFIWLRILTYIYIYLTHINASVLIQIYFSNQILNHAFTYDMAISPL
jgi:hypothetical protein